MVTEWNKAVEDSSEKPELVDMAQAVSTFMAVKDDEELVFTEQLPSEARSLISFSERNKDCWSFDQNSIATPYRTQTRAHLGPGG